MTKGKGSKGRGDRLTVVLAASEAVPFAKTGGLADVAGALAGALARLGHEVHLFVPLYRTIDRHSHPIPKRGRQIAVPISSRSARGELRSMEHDGYAVHFVRNDGYFDREHLYTTPGGDYHDNAERFVFFSRAVLEGIKKLGIVPDVIHVNDWQTALIPVYLKTLYAADPVLGRLPSVLTIHNLGYQGHFWELDWHLTGLDWSLFAPSGLEFYHRINFLKGGILYADRITTVSPTYAREIRTAEHGWGLDGVLRDRAGRLTGILNGIDAGIWDPAADPLIAAPYSAADLAGKGECRRDLLAAYGLPADAEGPVLGVVSRLAEQKGFDLLLPVIDGLIDRGASLTLLGAGQGWIEHGFRELARRRPDRVGIRIGYDEGLAHRIEAGADLFLMPSHYEPCGLNQMYSLAYGTPPVVRATGGLNDTVQQFDAATGSGNGFKFGPATSEALFWSATGAIDLYRNDPASFRTMMVNGMSEDHSWGRAAASYVSVYELAREER